ncbi:MAG: hypothetical protein L3K01_01975 [Thermoplasmata archaeon]|nr:hypothetical protein [Thermoplasmata archaeon]
MTAATPAPPGALAELRALVRRAENLLFPPAAGPSQNPRGVLAAALPEWPGLLLAFLVAISVAVLLEQIISVQPIPPGGDPGEWTSTSFAYAGLPYPSWIIPGQYPPLLFPLLGLLVRLAGGAAGGAKAYVGVVAVLIGLSTYFLARGLTRRRSTALVAEALVLLNPSFLQMFFWGAYPNLLGFVFLNLSLAFHVRYIRSRRPLHLLLFWAAAAAGVLTHSLVGAIELGTIGLVLLMALSIRVLPRAIVRSRAGLAGIGLFVGSIGTYYGLTYLLKIHHPNYFQSGAFAYVKNGLGAIFYLLARPFVPAFRVPITTALPLILIIVGVLTLYILGMRMFWKNRMTLGTMVTVSLALAPTGLAAVGWELSVVTDYVRFGYFLVTPVAIGLALFLDWFMSGLARRAARAVAAPGAPSHPPRTSWHAPGIVADPPAANALFAFAVVIVFGVSALVTVPALPMYEANNTKEAHDSTFIHALDLIRGTGVHGSLLTVPGAAKWSRSLLVRNAYSPNLPARYTFDASHLVDEESAYFALTSRFAVTNGVVAVSGLGTNLSAGNATFEFQAAYFGVFTPVAALPIGNLSVVVDTGGVTRAEPVTEVTNVLLGPPGKAWFEVEYAGAGFTLAVRASVAPGTTSATIAVRANATAGSTLLALNGNVTGPSVGFTHFSRGPTPGSLNLTPGTFAGRLATLTQLVPSSALLGLFQYNHLGAPAHGSFVLNSTTGSPELNLSILLSTPGASNLIRGLPPLLSTSATWENWSIRFVLYTSSTQPGSAQGNLLPNEVAYLEAEYGATVIGVSGRWTVLLLPSPDQLPGSPVSLVGAGR